MKFVSKYDWFFVILIVLTGVICIGFSAIAFVAGFFEISGLLIFLFSFILYLFTTVSIELKDKCIIVKLGFIKKTIKYENIREVKKTRNIISSFATSIGRIGLRTKNKNNIFAYVYVSPKDEVAFIGELKKKLENNVVFVGF